MVKEPLPYDDLKLNFILIWRTRYFGRSGKTFTPGRGLLHPVYPTLGPRIYSYLQQKEALTDII